MIFARNFLVYWKNAFSYKAYFVYAVVWNINILTKTTNWFIYLPLELSLTDFVLTSIFYQYQNDIEEKILEKLKI